MAYPSVSYTFTNGTVADGANVSTNFSNLVSGLSDGTKDLNMNAATFAGNLTANGNIVLGNAASDTLALTGIITLGALSTLTVPIGAAATPSLNFTSSTTTGFSCAAADTLIVSTAATARITISSAGLITIGTGGVIANVLGAVTVPSYSFTGDLNTGMWSSTADTINFSTAGVERMRMDSSGRVLIGNASTLNNYGSYLRAGLDTNLGAWNGTTSSNSVSVFDTNKATAGGGNLRVMTTDSAAINLGGSICLGGNYTTTTGSLDFAEIAGRAEGASGSSAGYLIFCTRVNAGNTTERLRIESTGRIYASSAIQRALGSTPDSTSTTTCYIEAGTFTSTITNGANVTSTGTLTMHWTRVGNIVTCGFQCSSIIATSGTSVQTQFAFTLPISASYTAGTNLSGVGVVDPGGTGVKQVAAIYGVAGLKAQFDYLAVNTTNSGLYGTFTYFVQ